MKIILKKKKSVFSIFSYLNLFYLIYLFPEKENFDSFETALKTCSNENNFIDMKNIEIINLDNIPNPDLYSIQNKVLHDDNKGDINNDNYIKLNLPSSNVSTEPSISINTFCDENNNNNNNNSNNNNNNSNNNNNRIKRDEDRIITIQSIPEEFCVEESLF
jgi:hypothetical protein